MNDEYKITIQYRDSKMNVVAEKTYDLESYVDMLRQSILKTITDVEDIVDDAGDYNNRVDWPDNIWMQFVKIKHRLLDVSGELHRLPKKIEKVGG